ncbi:MFS transporter [Novosphingobium sp. FSY-8]|uniref:MFS transporter n=1 Tax=Novosphingobium ovatum TaxID=1908523 RepID=A0ABW9XFX4_9SPHN|nr:MFS transporter [Novosphingobium ovatum]NBC37453.1 MFS transporter [Novosphingobium ovatum]
MTNLDQPLGPAVAEESDFSPRKLRISAAIILGTLFGSTVLPMMAIGLLLLPMTGEFGWSRTQFSLGMTAMMLGGACSSWWLGWLVDRLGVRVMVIGGTVCVGLMTMALSLQNGALWQFITGFAVLGGLGSTAIGYQKVLSSLFTKHRGKALAIFGVESSLAGAVSIPLIQWLLVNHGWRGVFVGMGAIILATVPVSLLWLAEPDAPAPGPEAGADPQDIPGTPLAQALKTRQFWFITLAGVLAIIPAIGLSPHLVPYLIDRGVPMGSALGVVTAMSVAMAVGTLAGGWSLDHSRGAWIAAPFSLISTLALVGLLFLSGSGLGQMVMVASFVAMGFAAGAKRPMATYFQLRFFGLRAFGGISGAQAPFLAIGMGVAPPLVGLCFDRFGTYVPALWAMVGLMGLTVALYLVLGPYRYDRQLAPIARPD